MNITALYMLYLLYTHSQQIVNVDITAQVANSLRYVIDNYFMKYSSAFVFILSCPREHTWYYFRDLMEELFKHGNTMKVQIVMNDTTAGYVGLGERNFNLIFVDGGDSFLNIDLASKVKNYDTNEYYFVFVQNRDQYLPSDIERILDYCWKHYIINVDILIQKATGEILVYTYFPFTATNCGKAIPVEINRFRNGSMDNKNLFPEKLLNMYQCPLKIALWELPPFLSMDYQKTGRDAIGGFEGELLKALSDSMNFRIDYKVLSNNERGRVLENETTGALRMLQQREVDLSLGFFSYSTARASILTPTDTYYQSREIFVVLQNSPNYLTPEMILYPFSQHIWVLLIITFGLVLGILIGAMACTRQIERSTTTHGNISLNFIAVTLGMASMLFPRRYFDRLFMATWMLCTLVIRAQYQALIFHLIRNNFFKTPPSSVDKLVQEGYKFVMNYLTYNAMSSILYIKETSFDITFTSLASIELGSAFSYLEEHPDEKLVAVEPNEFFLYYGAQNRKAGVFVSMPDTLLIQSTCMYLTKHSFLINRINDLVRWMNAYGLMTSWVNKALHSSYFMSPPDAKQTIIGQDELKVAFYLCGMLLGLATIIFILEILSVRFKILRRAFERL